MKLVKQTYYFMDFSGTEAESGPRQLTLSLSFDKILNDAYISYQVSEYTLFGLITIDRDDLYTKVALANNKKTPIFLIN